LFVPSPFSISLRSAQFANWRFRQIQVWGEISHFFLLWGALGGTVAAQRNNATDHVPL